MNAAGYHCDLHSEQGDPVEASLAHRTDIYANWFLPTCCMFTVRESDIVGNTVVISWRMIDKFGCADDRIDITRYGRFERH